MNGVAEGTINFEIKGTLKEVAELVLAYRKDGWNIGRVSEKRNWPRFWIKTYTVRLEKDIIVETKHIIITPKTEYCDFFNSPE